MKLITFAVPGPAGHVARAGVLAGDVVVDVDRALERCFTMKNRSIARAKAAKATTTTRIPARRTAKAS